MGELEKFLDPDAGGAQGFGDPECPEGEVFFQGQVAALAGGGVVGPDLARGGVRDDRACQAWPAAVSA
ncbi:MAG: hypothetical protein ACRDOK_10130 [Streptosporangiaceae bacterium]